MCLGGNHRWALGLGILPFWRLNTLWNKILWYDFFLLGDVLFVGVSTVSAPEAFSSNTKKYPLESWFLPSFSLLFHYPTVRLILDSWNFLMVRVIRKYSLSWYYFKLHQNFRENSVLFTPNLPALLWVMEDWRSPSYAEASISIGREGKAGLKVTRGSGEQAK